jgi:hypothetical protein
MTDLFEKIPDFLIGPFLAALVWFGFNYAVLAQRAMDRAVKSDLIPQCVHELKRSQNAVFIPKLPEWPQPRYGRRLPDIFNPNKMVEAYATRLRISPATRFAICTCGAERTARSIKFDYAVHTASFRLIQPESVGSMRASAISLVKSQACGALPWLNIGRRS